MATSFRQVNYQFELLWWVITTLVLAIALGPIYLYASTTYQFWSYNILYVVVCITLTRYLFWLRFTFWAQRQRLKVVGALLCLPLIFYLVQGIFAFQDHLDSEGLMSLVLAAPIHQQVNLAFYIKNQYLLFGVGSVVSAVAFAVRLIISVWKLHNRGTV